MPHSSFSFTLRNDLDELARLNAGVAAFVEANQVHPKTAFALELVLEEILTNTIKYAYTDSKQHEISVHVDFNLSSLMLRIEDDGNAFDPRAVPEPPKGVPLQNMKIGGLGIHLVRNMVEKLDYRRDGSRNILEVAIPLNPVERDLPADNVV